ncbi:RDD family protein [Vibrio rumoiensis]|uniref:RDD family protein n=1 Tax=Vibrio rumoiensis TaxID=76258 RepID=A0ABW7IW77_9VIBR|nr:RDD family protein [Vibrio rumoiensis]
MNSIAQVKPAGFLRRLAAIFYDALIIIAVEMIAVGIVIATMEALLSQGLVSYGSYIDASDLLNHHPIWSVLFHAYVVMVWVGFLSFFWMKGQTLGMRAWKLRIQNENGTPITFFQSLIRMATSLFGLGNITVLFDSEKRALQDMWAKCQVIQLAKVD